MFLQCNKKIHVHLLLLLFLLLWIFLENTFAYKVLSVIVGYHTLQIEHERRWIGHRRLITVLKLFENALYCSNATHLFCDFIAEMFHLLSIM